MRANSDNSTIHKLMEEFGKGFTSPVCIYFTGGATAVLLGYRETTIDVDIKAEPETSQFYHLIKNLKETLNINIELAAPDNFIPMLPNWRERSIFINRIGKVDFKHYDLYSQVIAKVERGSKQDLTDARNFVKHSLETEVLTKLFKEVKEEFIRYPAINVEKLENKLLAFIHDAEKHEY